MIKFYSIFPLCKAGQRKKKKRLSAREDNTELHMAIESVQKFPQRRKKNQKEIIVMIQRQGWNKTVQEIAKFMNQETEEIESVLKEYLTCAPKDIHRGAGRENSSCPEERSLIHSCNTTPYAHRGSHGAKRAQR